MYTYSDSPSLWGTEQSAGIWVGRRNQVAEKRGTINYEVLCLLSDRVPRSYD